MNLPPMGDLPIPAPLFLNSGGGGDEGEGGNNDDSLKQVPEMPYEEEAEAIEMVSIFKNIVAVFTVTWIPISCVSVRLSVC